MAFAKKLLADAQSIRDEPAFAEFLLERAYDFGSKDVTGYPVAIEAAKAILLKPVPARAGWKGNSRWQARLVSLARFWYQQASPTERPAAAEQLVVLLVRSGDEQGLGINLEAATTFFAEAVRVAEGNKCPSLPVARGRFEEADGWKRRAAYEAAMKANPKDVAAARGLALFWLLETETPSKALGYLERTGDERLKKYGRLVVGSVEDVGESDLLSLGEWWRAQASDLIGRAKARALRRAVAAYGRFLVVHPQPDGTVLEAKKAVEEVTKQIKAMG
ncbi:MAG: hypothetical protein NT031_19845, partial [Planctomycetota bacterium]|nr:hypothetical protein [Planctomycetota bacterium]